LSKTITRRLKTTTSSSSFGDSRFHGESFMPPAR
jgi:hypothetical protein